MYDTYEIVGMKTTHGIVYSDPFLPDSDFDGLTDGEEMGELVTNPHIGEQYFKIVSFPDNEDSDGDDLKDDVDSNPFEYNVGEITVEHQSIIDLAEKITVGEVKQWSTLDIIEWKTIGGDESLESFENDWISGYKSVFIAAAEYYDIPDYLLAGVLKVELGGQPIYLDYIIYSLRDELPEELKLLPQLQVDKDKTSIGNASVQIRRAAESLNYGNNLSDEQRKRIFDSLMDPKESILIASKHLSDLRDVDFKGVGREELTEDKVRIIASRYNLGPDIPIDAVVTEYGDIVVGNRTLLEELLYE